MNLLLLRPDEISDDGTALLRGRRAVHAREVLKAHAGDTLVTGVLGGRIGTGTVISSSGDALAVRVSLDRDAPPRSPVDLLLALPRPKVLRRVLQAAASMGIGRIALVGSWRVEKSYWGSPALEPDAIREELALGLEQGRDTVPPDVLVRKLFKPFVEDELDAAFPSTHRLLAHVTATSRLDSVAPPTARVVLAIGPEGGWTPYEARRLVELGFQDFSLGPRALRVDAAVAYAVGQVEHWLRTRLTRA
ncbi:MAG TPA: 16S rRNA (uracil(1498)-N(3))-methyltransferase [Anaeromyxobacteraceae bacterium]|nr:16S rRNA (uracil(1498)-N(3))-methyltransferase [Anaeromyxobacteraceae bacterium]